MKSRTVLLAILVLLVSSAGFAQIRRGTIEISPFAGYLFGGEFARGTTALFNTDVDVGDHATYGIRLGYNVTSKLEVELQASRTETGFVQHDKGGKLFGGSSSPRLGDLDIDYLLANATFNFGHRRVVPYITLGGGAARLSPSVPGVTATREYKGTGTLGAGLKVFFNPNFGLRFDGRYYATWIRNDNNSDRQDRCDRDHNFRDCSDRRDWLTNGDVTGGIVFAF